MIRNLLLKQKEVGISWDISSMEFIGQTESVTLSDLTVLADLTFSADGTKLFVLARIGGILSEVRQYSLAAAFSITTATHVYSINVADKENLPQGLCFSVDGTRLYVVGTDSDSVHTYTLAVAWDLSTCFYTSSYTLNASNSANPQGITFKPDGTIMYTTNSFVSMYTLSTPWDVSTAIYSSKSAIPVDTAPQGIQLSSDGALLYARGGGSSYSILQYSLAIPWDVTTLTLIGSVNTVALSTSPSGIFVHPTGNSLYTSFTGGLITKITMSTAGSLQTARIYNKGYLNIQYLEMNGTAMCFNASGTKLFVGGTSNDKVHEFSLPVAWDISSASFTRSSIRLSTQDTTMVGIAISPTGDSIYMLGDSTNSVYKYPLSTAYDVSTLSTVSASKSVSANGGTTPSDVVFSPDGGNMYITDNALDGVVRYRLSTAWNISTATFTGTPTWLVPTQDTSITDVTFSSDGYKVYVVGSSSGKVHQYNLASPWSFASVTFYGSSVGPIDTTPAGITFSVDGTNMYVICSGADIVYRYTLSTAWDITTAVQSQQRYIDTYETSPKAIHISVDGTKLYIAGTSSDTLTCINLVTPFDLGSVSYTQSYVGVGAISGMLFSPDGMYLYTVDESRVLSKYLLSIPWVVSSGTVSLIDEEILIDTPVGISASADGTKLFIATSTAIVPYTSTTPWDNPDKLKRSAKWSSDFFYITSTAGIAFSSDGVYMFVLKSGDIYRYTLSSAWSVESADINSVVINKLAFLTTGTSAVVFSSDGTKMYVLDSGGDAVYQFDLGV